MSTSFDKLDLTILRLMVEQPRAGVREYARQLGIARGTAQARIDKLQRAGVIASYAPRISPTALGFGGLAYIHIHLAQGELDTTSRLLAAIPEIIAADSIAGEGDLLCHVVAKDNLELERVIQRIIATPGVVRTRTEIVLSRRIEARVIPLIEALAHQLG
ncbi:Lrp/AsnC family transcriptional regulator [Hoyosella rhizosphaerae]|uniref:AsnC family transcriptional regulator n=1 Tax=Hoyosella rhizosphaerae TaxID=1755582 RepID=A0A916UHA2_9ACTN|nr:Lrp/AsnC family transcriptional regulator [Hoyosella rhizosphaerae]MBN4928156.1 Lrp/AsnC family transcriptional regulator [Hoyosella rhizosphaerae]GGC72863.1 AsnC family transcriptional regulator [Hoyosella rhizosphaerae]